DFHVTGVQTCALPIFFPGEGKVATRACFSERLVGILNPVIVQVDPDDSTTQITIQHLTAIGTGRLGIVIRGNGFTPTVSFVVAAAGEPGQHQRCQQQRLNLAQPHISTCKSPMAALAAAAMIILIGKAWRKNSPARHTDLQIVTAQPDTEWYLAHS